MSDPHFHDLQTSSYKMIYFKFNIYKWALTLPMVESSSAVFAMYVVSWARSKTRISRISRIFFSNFYKSVFSTFTYGRMVSTHLW